SSTHQTQNTRGTVGEGTRRPCLLEPPKRSPSRSLLSTVSFLCRVPACSLPQRRDRVPSGAGCWFTEHGESRPRRRKGRRVGPRLLGLGRLASIGAAAGRQRQKAGPQGFVF